MSWRNITNSVGYMEYADGAKVPVPIIEVGRNGHVYIPKVLREWAPHRYDASRTTIGRGDNARDEMKQHVVDYATAKMMDHEGLPVKIGTPQATPVTTSPGNHALMVTYWNNTWGYVTLGIYTRQSTYYNTVKGSWVVIAHKMALNYDHRFRKGDLERSLVPYQYSDLTDSWAYPFTGEESKDFELVAENMRNFVEDPWESIAAGMPNAEKAFIDGNLGPREGFDVLRGLPYEPGPTKKIETELRTVTTSDVPTDQLVIGTTVHGSAHLYSESQLNTVIVENIDDLRLIFKAFELRGIKFHVTTRTGEPGTQYYGKPVVTGFTLELPAQPVLGQQHPHEIKVDASGIFVECGYITDEARYVDYQKRHMKDVLGDMNDLFAIEKPEPEWSETTHELGGQ